MITEELHNLNVDNEKTEIVKYFVHFGSVINPSAKNAKKSERD